MLKVSCTKKQVEWACNDEGKSFVRNVTFEFDSPRILNTFNIIVSKPTQEEVGMFEVGQSYTFAPSGQVA